MAINNQPPECFGKLWEPTASECAGGHDPAFVGYNGSHTRPKCDFFDSCRVRTTLSKTNQQVVPPAALNRNMPPYQPFQPPYYGYPPQHVPGRQPTAGGQPAQPQQGVWPTPWQGMPPWAAGMPPEMMQQMMQRMMGMPPQVFPGQFPFSAQMSPIQFMPTNYDMPSYLAVSEPRGGSFWNTLGREVFRGMGKALGHSIAHFFDSVPFGRS